LTAPLLRVATAGSVDDGKSTLIGRLLWDSKAIFQDQVDAVTAAAESRGQQGVNLAMLTDGLRAERDQGITIDVAYRYFATPRRRFILADTPGHVEYTRNMVTGASTADVAVILIDARHGVVEQSRRHAAIASLLGVPRVVVAVNKMDLVGWDKGVFDVIAKEFRAFVSGLSIDEMTFIPLSALAGDNVVTASTHMHWYDGPPLLTFLEGVPAAVDDPEEGVRLPVQWADGSRIAGRIVAGVLRPGDEVVVLPSGAVTTVASIDTYEATLDAAGPNLSITVQLADDVVVERGDLVCHVGHLPATGDRLEAMVCWLAEEPLVPNTSYRLKHTTRWCDATVENVVHRLDIETLDRDEHPAHLGLNDIGQLSLRLSTPLAVDPYHHHRGTGSFILVDPVTNATVAAGMVLAIGASAVDITDQADSPGVLVGVSPA